MVGVWSGLVGMYVNGLIYKWSGLVGRFSFFILSMIVQMSPYRPETSSFFGLYILKGFPSLRNSCLISLMCCSVIVPKMGVNRSLKPCFVGFHAIGCHCPGCLGSPNTPFKTFWVGIVRNKIIFYQ